MNKMKWAYHKENYKNTMNSMKIYVSCTYTYIKFSNRHSLTIKTAVYSRS